MSINWRNNTMERTLIVAQGLERERIIAAISIHSPTKLIILRSKHDATESLTKHINKHIELLKKALFSQKSGIKLYPFLLEIDDTKKVDFFNLPAAIAEIDAIVKNEINQGREVAIDISSGNKIVNIALFVVAQKYGLRVTYCVAGKYASMNQEELSEETIPEQIAFSVREQYEIPRLPIKIEKIPVDVLKALEEIGGKAASITTLAKKLYSSQKEIGKREIISVSRKIDILAEYGYVIKKRKGREFTISITNDGKKILALESVI